MSCTASFTISQEDIEQGQVLHGVTFTAVTGAAATPPFSQPVTFGALTTTPNAQMLININTPTCTQMANMRECGQGLW